ncbi:PilZ domain-containing protein [Croceicoccus hydrothermalis]|uniref:PilZ domain-containing protein n=1 Tax=Croceicoccus hydrothermalis TaxID=2867964 RepID=UPI001EFBE27F|nr:PilZ domain-containing protein [Croceicoccus hydrothermalis]
MGAQVQGGARLSVTDLRRATRHPVDYPVVADHRIHGDLPMRLCNISANGFMAQSDVVLDRGERLTVRLPEIGRIEAHVIWSADRRAGCQLERVIPPDRFAEMLSQMRPRARIRPRG